MHFLGLQEIGRGDINFLIGEGIKVKSKPADYANLLKGKTLVMIFAKPSLRTRLSFEVGMTQLGGHAIYYDVSTSPFGKGKESISDFGKVTGLFADIVMARLFNHSDIVELAGNSSVPVINGLTNFEHPCQIMADLMTIKEKKGRLDNLKLAYLGDGNNNIAHSLLFACPKLGMKINVATPNNPEFLPQSAAIKAATEFAKEYHSRVSITDNPHDAARDADVVVTDSWMSYHIPKEKESERVNMLRPYQVNSSLMAKAKSDAIFLHCLPAMRGQEVTADVIDGPQSVVLDEASNRLHIQKAIMLFLLKKITR